MTRVYVQTIRRAGAPLVTGTNGAWLKTGDVVTGAAVRDVKLINRNIEVRYETPSPDDASQRGAHFLYRRDSAGVMRRAVSARYGDWCYIITSITTACDRVDIVEVSATRAIVTFTWDALSLGAGPVFYGPRPGYALNYGQMQENPNFKHITVTRFKKTICITADSEGYYLGYSTDPHLGPHPRDADTLALKHDPDFGERECGTGGEAVVGFASSGNQAHFPAWGARTVWNAAVALLGAIANRAFWPGVSDTLVYQATGYTEAQRAAFNATQPLGFPAEQATGPTWIATIPTSDMPFCQYLVQNGNHEIGVWQFGTTAYGQGVNHFTNGREDSRGIVAPYQVFIAATPYNADPTPVVLTAYDGASVAYGNEPSISIRETIAQKAKLLTWPI